MISVKIEGFEELRAEAEAGGKQLVQDMRRAARDAADVAIERMRALAPEVTGDLKRNIKPHIRDTARGASGEIVLGEEYASHVVEGRGPVRAKDGGWLRFKYKGQGPWIFRREVGPADGNDFVTPAVSDGQQSIEREADAAVAKLKARLER